MTKTNYCFVAKTSNWRNSEGVIQEKSVLLDLRRYDEVAEENIRGVWEKMRLALNNHHKQFHDEPNLPSWSTWKVHERCTLKRGVEDRQKFIAWDGDVIAGYLFLRPRFPSLASPGRNVMYVENIATAPGNKRTDLWCRQLKYVGLALLAFSVYQSKEQGFSGDLGLHAADAEAEHWYEHLNASRGHRLFLPPALNVAAPFPIGDDGKDKPFLETITDGAERLLEEYFNV